MGAEAAHRGILIGIFKHDLIDAIVHPQPAKAMAGNPGFLCVTDPIHAFADTHGQVKTIKQIRNMLGVNIDILQPFFDLLVLTGSIVQQEKYPILTPAANHFRAAIPQNLKTHITDLVNDGGYVLHPLFLVPGKIQLHHDHAEFALLEFRLEHPVDIRQGKAVVFQLLVNALFNQIGMLAYPLHVLIAGSHMAYLLTDLLQYPVQLRLFHRLQQIIFHLVFQRIIGILKLPVSADDHEPAHISLFPGLPDHVQAVLARHGDVRQHNIRVEFLYPRLQGFSIMNALQQFQTQGIKVDQFFQHPADEGFIIRNNQPDR